MTRISPVVVVVQPTTATTTTASTTTGKTLFLMTTLWFLWTTTTITTRTCSSSGVSVVRAFTTPIQTGTRSRRNKPAWWIATKRSNGRSNRVFATLRSSRLFASTASSTTSTTSSQDTEASSSSNALRRNNDDDDNDIDDDGKLYWTTNRVRRTFVDYFVQQHNHTFYASSPCAPLNDPTLLFTNAGMNQFKPVFLGQVDPNSPLAALSRAVNSQKCIRAGGKHNDLDDVGKDTYHHTFFEMLGTWSFHGDYFKEKAIGMAWDLLTKVYALDPNRIYATYFQGNEQVPADVEARDVWLQYLPESHVLPCSAKDNFWEMGDTGPCGPCTEIHYDRIGGGRDASSLVNADDPNVIEIWNIVFIQYNRNLENDDGMTTSLQLLPAQHVDTGMGLERLVSLLQNRSSNYDIDCFQPILQDIATKFSQVGDYTGQVGADDAVNNYKDTAYRAIADHVRTLSFALADGAVPNNEGRGYVLRRILRRAARYGQQVLQCPPGFLHQLIPTVVQTFRPAYPELYDAESTIMEIVKEEEEAFGTLLERGLKYFEELKNELLLQSQQEGAAAAAAKLEISGEQAFFLYDTLGFPLDLTELMAQEAGLTVDVTGFHQAMQEQKDRSRQAQKDAAQQRRRQQQQQQPGQSLFVDVGELQAEQTSFLQKQGIAPTDDFSKYTWDEPLEATVQAIYTDQGKFLQPDAVQGGGGGVAVGDFSGLVLDQTSFYAEAGGQEADIGEIQVVEDGTNKALGTFVVSDVQVYAGYVLHKGQWLGSNSDDDDDDDNNNNSDGARLAVGTRVVCQVNYDRRRLIAPNHSMTHVLNAALRQVLGDKVEQRGSLCNDEKLRFDFTHKQALTLEELEQVQAYCQSSIALAQPVTSRVLPLAEAQAIPGVRAVFGEVYPDPVRVITIGHSDDDAKEALTSIEFCGGTHLTNTEEAGAFCLVEETAVAKGIRRISAVTQTAAKEALALGEDLARRVQELEQQLDDDDKNNKNNNSTVNDVTATELRKELDATVIAAPLKAKLRNRISTVQAQVLQVKKQALQQRVDTALKELKVQVDEAVASGQSSLVARVDIGADGKASQRVRNAVQEWAPNLAFMGLSLEDGESGKLLAFAQVPQDSSSSSSSNNSLKANEWVLAALQPCQGKGGGKADNAQGQAPECNNVDEVVQAAQAFANQALLEKSE